MVKGRTKDSSSKTKIYLRVNREVREKLDKDAVIENMPLYLFLSKIILNYKPTPAVKIPGKIKCIYVPYINGLRRRDPLAYVISIYHHDLFNIDKELYHSWKRGEIGWGDLQRKYIEQLSTPECQEGIAKIRKYAETQDVYITSFEPDTWEHSVRQTFVDYVNGDLVWK